MLFTGGHNTRPVAAAVTPQSPASAVDGGIFGRMFPSCCESRGSPAQKETALLDSAAAAVAIVQPLVVSASPSTELLMLPDKEGIPGRVSPPVETVYKADPITGFRTVR